MSNFCNWYKVSGNMGDVVISSRVRLARNINGLPCPDRMSEEQRISLNEMVLNAAGQDYEAIYLDKLDGFKSFSMTEKNIISRNFAAKPKNRLLLLSKMEPISIMVGEEDHIRIQSIVQGLDLDSAYDYANKADDKFGAVLNFAFDEKLGYLTACPTNLGTGMRASVMLHLPILTEGRVMGRIADSLTKIGLTIRGCYGEGSGASGDLYQLSNQVTLGLDEKSAIDNLKNVTSQFIGQERERLKNNIDFQDKLFRSLGILKSARKLSSDEFMKLISIVRAGVAVGEIDNIDIANLNALIIEVQPASLMEKCGCELSPSRRDEERAKIVRHTLK